MNKKSSATGLDYGKGHIPSIFAKIFFPTLLGMIFNALITIVDGIFVGQGVGPDGIAAVNIIAPIYMVSTGLGLMFGIGVSVIAGVALAQKQALRACHHFTQATIVTTVIISIIVALLLGFSSETARLLGSSEHLLPHALDYLHWIAPGLFFVIFLCMGMMVIRLDGSPKYAMMCNIVPAVTNIVLDYVFVFPLGMGVKGAAIATSISELIGALMVIIYFCRLSYVIRFAYTSVGIIRNLMQQITIGSSALVTEVAMSIMMITGNHVFMQYFGENGVAAFSIACYIFPLMFMMSNGVAQSAQPIISYNYGAGLQTRVKEAFRLSTGVALTCGLISFCAIALCARGIVAMFIDPECEAGQLAVNGLPVYAVCAVFFAVNISFITYYQSITKAVNAITFTLMRGVILLVPAFFILPTFIPYYGVWAAIPTAEFLTLVGILLSWRICHKR